MPLTTGEEAAQENITVALLAGSERGAFRNQQDT
jgi:hypothetical protein